MYFRIRNRPARVQNRSVRMTTRVTETASRAKSALRAAKEVYDGVNKAVGVITDFQDFLCSE